MNLGSIRLIDLQTKYMQKDKTTQALCTALEPLFKELADEVKLCLIYSRVDELDDATLDELAWQMHVDFYDSSYDMGKKKALIKDSIIIHKTKGTSYAVEKLIETLFDEGIVEEWFEYGGEPYTFRVITNNSTVTNERASEFIRALNTVKNLRSWLDKVVITQNENLPLYFAGIVQIGDFVTIKEG